MVGTVVDETAAANSATMSPEAWQALLAAELSPKRARALLPGLAASERPYEYLRGHRDLADSEKSRIKPLVEQALEAGLRLGIHPWEPGGYSEPLRESPIAPVGLFTWGDTACLHAPCVGIVGTRSATAYGRAVAAKFAESFARAGVTVVSGGAIGIDTAAHKGALSGGGATAAVLACGVDKPYPAINAALFREIRANGCMISQFAVGSPTADYKFLVRNGVVASLSRAIVVIEAPIKSGAMNTANTAAEIGRPVFVVPSTIDQLSFAGSHALIREGATLVDHPNQVLEAIQVQASFNFAERVATSKPGAKILRQLGTMPLSEERIAEQTGLSPTEVLSELTLLELDGLVVRSTGGFTKTL